MQITKIVVNEQMKEVTRHGTVKFPMQVYLDDFSKYDLGIVRWHWHNEIEFAVVLQGKVEVSAGETSVTLQQGEGFFINQEILHMARPLGTENVIMFSVVANPLLLSDGEQSIIHEKYVAPLLHCIKLPFIPFNPKIDWQNQCIQALQTIDSLSRQTPFMYELLIRNALCQIWYLLVSNHIETIQAFAPHQTAQTGQQRIKQMITYIHRHYQENVTLADIALSAHISKSECSRCFQRFLGMNPFHYLMEYRLENAAELLLETNQPVTDIALRCGYNSHSYFTKLFKHYVGLSPLQYRQKHLSP